MSPKDAWTVLFHTRDKRFVSAKSEYHNPSDTNAYLLEAEEQNLRLVAPPCQLLQAR